MTESKPRPFGARDKIGYLLGNVANDLTFLPASMFLTVFYTDVLKINPAAVGAIFLITRVTDAFTDTAMGRIADRMRPGKAGKFRPWLLRMGIPVAVASILMYQPAVANAPHTLRIVYALITYLLWSSVCYTAVNIPYGSMASVMSSDADHRAALSAFRGMGSLLPQILTGVVLPLFLYTTRQDGSKAVNAPAFPIAALMFGVLAAVCYFLCYRLCRERIPATEKGKRRDPFRKSLRSLLSNRALIGISAVYVAFLAAQMLNQTVNNYIFKDYFNNTVGLTVINAVAFVPILLLVPAAVPLSRKIGKKELGVAAAVIGSVTYGLLFFLRTENMWLYTALSVLGSLGFGLFNLIAWAFVSDVIDDHQIRSGLREDGTVYAVCSFSRKIGQAVASAVGAWSLSWIGYVEGASRQTAEVNNGIYTVATLIPALLYLAVGLILGLVYPLNRKRVAENVKILEQKRREAERKTTVRREGDPL